MWKADICRDAKGGTLVWNDCRTPKEAEVVPQLYPDKPIFVSANGDIPPLIASLGLRELILPPCVLSAVPRGSHRLSIGGHFRVSTKP
jgi:hypothetical protein